MKKNILIFPAGTEIAFEIVNALKYSKFVKLYGGTSTHDHSDFIYENLIDNFPYIGENGFIDYLNEVIKQYSIDCVYPAHDSASLFFSDNVDKINAQVIIADSKTTGICRSKKDTYEYLREESFIPKTYSSIDDNIDYPCFIKPTVGQGSNGAKKVNNKDELIQAFKQDNTIVICEYLDGMEYTIDCFTDKNGKLLVAKMRDRSRIKTGISVRSQSIDTPKEVKAIADIINSKFQFKGAWFFQLKKDANKNYKLLEISPRIPGTMGLSRNQGINFPMLTLFVFWGYDVKIIDNNYGIMLDRAFYSAYKIELKYEYIYVDFDDTLIIDNKVNSDLMRLLYQSLNKNKSIILLSKHSTNIYDDLKKYKISVDMFSKIIVIPKEEEKYKYIEHRNSIFIDDSFSERFDIKSKLQIPVFDLDMIESLIDWRI